MDTDRIKRRQLIFRSRKGLLELDLMLTQYCKNGLRTLHTQALEAYEYLLDLPDQDFLIILLNTDVSNIPDLLQIDSNLAKTTDMQVFIEQCTTIILQIQSEYKKIIAR